MLRQSFSPPTSQRGCAWATLFNAGCPLGPYVARLGMAGRILDILSTWNDSAVTASVRAYRMEQSLSLKFDNYTYRVDLMQFAAHSTLSPEFGLVGYFRFSAFVGFSPNAFRCAENQSIRSRSTERAPGEDTSSISDCDFSGGQCLVTNLARRKHQRYAAAAIRPCSCAGSLLVHKSICPVRISRPIARAMFAPLDLLFPTHRRHNANRALKAPLEHAVVPDFQRCSMYFRRRGWLVAIKNPNRLCPKFTRTSRRKQGNSRPTLIYTQTRKLLPMGFCGV